MSTDGYYKLHFKQAWGDKKMAIKDVPQDVLDALNELISIKNGIQDAKELLDRIDAILDMKKMPSIIARQIQSQNEGN